MGWCTSSIGQCVAGSSPACPTSPYGLLLIMPNADRAGRSAHHSPVRSIRNSTQVDKGTVLKTDRRRKSCVGSNPTCSANAKAMCGAWLGAYALPGRLDPANPYFYNSSDRHPGKTGPRRAESRYQPQGRTMRFARRVRCCRCKNQRGWAREFLTWIDLKNRDALRRL